MVREVYVGPKLVRFNWKACRKLHIDTNIYLVYRIIFNCCWLFSILEHLHQWKERHVRLPNGKLSTLRRRIENTCLCNAVVTCLILHPGLSPGNNLMYISCNIGWLRPTTAANGTIFLFYIKSTFCPPFTPCFYLLIFTDIAGSKFLCQTCSIKKSFCIVQVNS